jgi:hypothetical protein
VSAPAVLKQHHVPHVSRKRYRPGPRQPRQGTGSLVAGRLDGPDVLQAQRARGSAGHPGPPRTTHGSARLAG